VTGGVVFFAARALERRQFIPCSPGEQPRLHVFVPDEVSTLDLSIGFAYLCEQGFASW